MFSLSVTMATVTVRGQDRGVVSVQTALPVVDLRDEPAVLRQRLGRVAHEVGFFHLTGHDVPEELIARVLDASRRFFALPQAAKDAIAMVEQSALPGLHPVGRGTDRRRGGLARADRPRTRTGPRLDAQMPVLHLPAELAARARGVTVDPSKDRIYPVYGRNAWKSRVRAHPDVAAAHRYGQP